MLTLCIITSTILSNCAGELYYFDKHTGLQHTNRREVHAVYGIEAIDTEDTIDLIGYDLPELEDLGL